MFVFLLAGASFTGYFIGRYRENVARAAQAHLTITVVNVGHGEAAWIRTPHNRFILIGGGPPEAGNRVVESLRQAGAKQIDLLVMPYPYAEAIGGIPDIVTAFPVQSAIEPGGPRVNQVQEAVRELLDSERVPVHMARAGDHQTIDDVVIDVLAPTDPPIQVDHAAANNSVVMRVGWGDTDFLFAGGIERAGEDALIARSGAALRADWLRVSRFGTRDASSPEFLRLVSPECVVVSVGYPNSGGYPHAETLARLQESGARLCRTDEATGDLTFSSDGTTVTGPQ